LLTVAYFFFSQFIGKRRRISGTHRRNRGVQVLKAVNQNFVCTDCTISLQPETSSSCKKQSVLAVCWLMMSKGLLTIIY
jgi:hypothetical protein